MKGLLAAVLAPYVALAQAPPVTWTGTYACAQGTTAVALTVQPTGTANRADALFHFKADPAIPGVAEGCFAMSGTFDARHLRLQATDWILHPADYVTVDVVADVGPDGQSAQGVVKGPGCTILLLRRAKRDPGEARCHRPTS